MITMRIRQTHARTFKKCKRKYKFQVIDKLVTKEKKPALSIGTACHAGRAAWLRTRSAADALQATLDSLRAEVEAFPQLAEKVHDDKDCGRHPCYNCCGRVALEVVGGYCNEFEKRFPGNSIRVLAVEIPFEVSLASHEDLELFLAGTLDCDAIFAEKYRVNFEFKTTSRQISQYFRSERLSEQHTAYGLAQRLVTGENPYGTLLDVARKPLKTQGPEFAHEIIPKTPEDFAEYQRDCAELLREVAYAVDNDYFPPNFDSCFGIYGMCEYLPICEQRGDPRVVKNFYDVVDDNRQIVSEIESE